MIYKKDANFPYPILSSTTLAYEESDFTIKVSFEEDGDLYRFKITPQLTSAFVEALLNSGDAQYLLVIQSKDTKFFPLDPHNLQVEIAKIGCHYRIEHLFRFILSQNRKFGLTTIMN